MLGLLALASLLWFAADVLLLLFAAVLLATLLRAATNGPTDVTGLADGPALAAVILVVLAVLVGGGLILAPQIASQVPSWSTTSARPSTACSGGWVSPI